MKKRKAIKELREQKRQFIKKDWDNDSISGWKLKTANMIIDYVGYDSNDYLSFSKFHFEEWTLNKELPIVGTEEYRQHMGLISILDSCVCSVKRNGIYSSSEPTNSHQSPSNTTKNNNIKHATIVILGILAILVALLIGYLQGAFDSLLVN